MEVGSILRSDGKVSDSKQSRSARCLTSSRNRQLVLEYAEDSISNLIFEPLPEAARARSFEGSGR
jgi:hypothetical protein